MRSILRSGSFAGSHGNTSEVESKMHLAHEGGIEAQVNNDEMPDRETYHNLHPEAYAVNFPKSAPAPRLRNFQIST